MTINNLDRGADDTMGVHNYIHFNPTSSKKKSAGHMKPVINIYNIRTNSCV